MRKASLYICYYSITEPLVQTQVLPYLVELGRRGIDITLLSFEPRGICRQELDTSAAAIADHGIRWHSLKYHGRPSLPATLYDIVVGALVSGWFCLTRRIKVVHARSHVPAAVGLVLKKLLGIRLIFDMRGLLADEYVDAGHWSEGSLKFRLTKIMERTFLENADAIVMLTRRIKNELTACRPGLRSRLPRIEVIPCCIDAKRFHLPRGARESYRRQRGWTDRRVIVYAGKVGGWYMDQEMIRFFVVARCVDDRFFLQVLTPADREAIESRLLASGVGREDFDVRCVSSHAMPHVLAACDTGISFIKPCYSKVASSPTKVAEYLGAGLPVITNKGIGDCDLIFNDTKLGFVISEFDETEYRRAALAVSEAIDDATGADYRRGYAVAELSIQSVGGPRYAAIYERLMGDALGVPNVENTPIEAS